MVSEIVQVYWQTVQSWLKRFGEEGFNGIYESQRSGAPRKINSSKEEVYNTIIKRYLNESVDNHTIPQYLFVTDENKQLIPNIKILHTETLYKDMHTLGHKDFNLKENKNKINTNTNNYYNYLNNDSIKIINEFYDYDFTLFNYKKLEIGE